MPPLRKIPRKRSNRSWWQNLLQLQLLYAGISIQLKGDKAHMGILYSLDSSFAQFAKYKDGVVYSAHGETVIGRYDSNVIYNANGVPIAVFRDGTAYRTTDPGTQNAQRLCFCKNDCICQATISLARFNGDQDGACAAAVLYFQKDFFEDSKPVYQPPLSPTSAFAEYTTIKSGFLKGIIAIAIVLSFLSIFYLPSVIVLLVNEDINFVLLIWGIAFIYGILHGKDLRLGHLRDFLPLIKTCFIPYIHAVWIQTLALCVYAAINHFFSLEYLAMYISLLPSEFFPLFIPLCSAQCIILWYIIYRRDHR